MNSLIKNLSVKHKTNLSQLVVRHFSFREKGRTRGKPPGVAPSIKEILERRNAIDETVHYKVDIGLPYTDRISKKETSTRLARIAESKKNRDLEKRARENTLLVPLEEVSAEWMVTNGPKEIRRIADHYGVYRDLYGEAYFYPVTRMNVAYKLADDEYAPVYYGNPLKANEAKDEPVVEITAKANTLHTLVLCNLDGHLNTPNMEYVHWFVGNIPEGDVSKGETIFEYLQPFPTHGTGYHRLVFVLYEHTEKLDYSSVPVKPKKNSSRPPDLRNFCTYEFYKERQDSITPCGLAFFQCDWDSSVTKMFHEKFSMTEPWFEYDFPRPYVRPQEWWPRRVAFNVYLDKYRDPKEISQEVLLKKLKTHHPFQKPEPPLKFPHAHSPYDSADKPSWLQVAIKKERFGWGRKMNQNQDILFPK